ncbi:endonuclease/exonuclease/phosphatase family protein [Roseivirga sp. E12]|uniref:endonuclease/exonuclease/phosphatase family protein n=1 Tax=Roseivirga sp. E12 TaxID=2819237 RepID=UPI001ABC840A|nr:endonuclease/exonuclease/phosphatase family protein [Roseivirga sp. E12]MBO3698431.1 endonuclease/exonuclease/phosphatase family protein [Roseivirga sp. E12]
MKSFFKLPVLIWIFITLLVYASVLISPLTFRYSGVVSFGIPFIILLNSIFLILAIIFKSKLGWVPFLLLICGWPFVNIAVSLVGNDDLNQPGIKILSYNVKWFVDARENNFSEVMDWIEEVDADILCFQEFSPTKGIAKGILDKGYRLSMDERQFNNAIFSRYPIINDGLILESNSINNIRFADLVIKEDTIRVYGVHLQSMGIDPNKIQDKEGIQSEYDDVKSKFLFSSTSRTEQIKVLLQHIEETNYPVVIAGDFNDVPFSYNYFQFRRRFANSFEEKGRGLGVTFNRNIPYLRIDNQFFSKEFKIKAFKTFDDIYYSDHFPLIGIYELSD